MYYLLRFEMTASLYTKYISILSDPNGFQTEEVWIRRRVDDQIRPSGSGPKKKVVSRSACAAAQGRRATVTKLISPL